MCLLVPHDFKPTLKFKDGKVVCYKVVCVDESRKKKRLIGVYRSKYKYKAGWNKPKQWRVVKHTYSSGSYEIHGGCIHVYTNREEPRNIYEFSPEYAIIPVMCYEKDLVAVGTGDKAAFKKIYIGKKSYARLVK